MEFDLNKVSPDNILKTIRDLKTEHYDDDELCRVEFYIDYNRRTFYVALTTHLGDRELEDEYAQIDLVVSGQSIETFIITNYLEYACASDKCELEFLEKYMNWSLDAYKPAVINRLAPYILGDKDSK